MNFGAQTLATWTWHRVCLFLAALLGIAAPARADELLIEFALSSNGSLLVTYVPPAGVTELKLMSDSPATRGFWLSQARSLDDCASLDAGRIVFSARPKCEQARIEFTPKLLAMRATYEAAAPVSDTGLLASTGFYAAPVAGHGLHWRWRAPPGGYVVHQGAVHRDMVEETISPGDVDAALAEGAPAEARDALGAEQYFYLGRAPLLDVPGGVLVRDPALASGQVDDIRKMLSQAMQTLGRVYGRMPLGPVGVVARASDLQGYQGDVTAGRMIGLRLNSDMSRWQPRAMERFIDHEVTHLWNSGVFHSDHDRPWLHEGHADWAALLLLRNSGSLDDSEARSMIESALNRCLSARGEKSAATMQQGWRSGDDPYACGMSLMMMAQAELQARSPRTVEPLVLLASLHTEHPYVDVPAFAAWADGGRAGPMNHLLQDADAGFAATLAADLDQLGLVERTPMQDGVQLPAELRRQLAVAILRELMVADCGGSISIYAEGETFRLGTEPKCGHLRVGQTVVSIQNEKALVNPVRGWAAVAAACRASMTVTVQYADGEETKLPCPRADFGLPMSELLRLRPEALSRLGLAARNP